MLITNFAAGELAETLFGRTDLPQYFQGVSRLENFDVIPAGGVSRRTGMKRIAGLEAEGRIIPFLIDRQNHCLLFFTPGKLQLYRNGTLTNTVDSVGGAPLYAALGEIREVQYAQNYNTMILAHRNYPPFIVSIGANSSEFSIEKFVINIGVEVIADDTMNTDAYYEQDKTYANNGYLFETGKYPACVTFFQGRLVFANTIGAQQRLFFSKANDICRFSTYKLFLKENKKYIVVKGAINSQSPVVELNDLDEGAKFTQRLLDYFISSPFFDAETKIESLAGRILTLSRGANIPAQLTDNEKAQLRQWKDNVDDCENNPLVLVVGQAYKAGSVIFYTPVTITLKATSITAEVRNEKKTVYFDEKNSRMTEIVADLFLRNLCNEVIKLILPDYEMNFNNQEQADNFYLVRYALWTNSFEFFNYSIRGKEFVGTPDVIYEEIRNYYYFEGAEVSIPFYTEELIEDRYPTPEDGFTFEIASDMNDAIRWAAQNKSLLVGTETGEWVIPAGITATNIQAVLNSRYGSDTLQATSIGDALCFFQSGKKGLVEYYIPQQDSNFRANNMAMLSGNMLRESPATDFDFISAPYTKIFVCRQDGVAAALLYERGTGTFAWGRVSTGGRIVSVATLPGESGFDDVYLAVERNGLFFLERLDERDQVYLDSYADWQNDPSGYDSNAVVYDETDRQSWPIATAPQRNPAHKTWAGYPYASRLRSMPVLANDQMKVNIIKTLLIRFDGSYMPRLKTRPDGPEEHIPRDEPFTGIIQVPFPGSYERDVFFELIHDGPTPCRVLAINAEAQ
jgi:hypothetical protein